MRGPKIDSSLEISAWGPKFVFFAKVGFETSQDVFFYVIFSVLLEFKNET